MVLWTIVTHILLQFSSLNPDSILERGSEFKIIGICERNRKTLDFNRHDFKFHYPVCYDNYPSQEYGSIVLYIQ